MLVINLYPALLHFNIRFHHVIPYYSNGQMWSNVTKYPSRHFCVIYWYRNSCLQEEKEKRKTKMEKEAFLCLHFPFRELMNSSNFIKEKETIWTKGLWQAVWQFISGGHCGLKAVAWIPLNRLPQSDTIELDNSKTLKGNSALPSWSAFLMLLLWMNVHLRWEGLLWSTH